MILTVSHREAPKQGNTGGHQIWAGKACLSFERVTKRQASCMRSADCSTMCAQPVSRSAKAIALWSASIPAHFRGTREGV